MSANHVGDNRVGECSDCGDLTTHSVQFVGIINSACWMCRPCFKRDYLGFAEVQRQFHELLDAGVSREEANRIMIERIDERSPS